MAEPLLVTLYDKAFNQLGWIGDPEVVTATPRHNQQPTATVQVANDHRLVPKLLTPGCRVVIDYLGQQIISGVVNLAQGAIFDDGSVTVQVQDDWSLLTDLLGWPLPTAAITAQTADYDVRSGPAETVLKGYMAAAVARTGRPVTIATDQGRGSSIGPVKMRLTPLADQLLPLIDGAGIGVTVRQVGAGLVLDCYEPAWYPLTLTPESGIIDAASWTLAPPALTRVVAGGQGDLAARRLRQYVDATAETLWGLVREGFIDATDLSATTEPAITNELVARAQQAVLEAAAKSGLALTLAETDTFRYGETLRVGDLVTAALIPGGDPITDVLREATVSWTADNGLTVTPVVGERTDDPSRTLARAIRSTATKLAQIVTRR